MDILTIIVLTGITNLTFALYSWQQVNNPESHAACRPWAQAQFIKAISFAVYAIALYYASNDLRWVANLVIILGCWAEVKAYLRLSKTQISALYLVSGFVLSSAIFTLVHFTSGDGPNNLTVVTISFLLVVPLGMNVYALYRLSRQHLGSVFPKVLLAVNLFITLLCFMRGLFAVNNPDYIITQAVFSNQLFMFTTFISALGNGIGFIGFLKERSDEKLQKRANIDYLTAIHNRQSFEKAVSVRIQEGERFTLYFIDIDKFKAVNDRSGHATGDEVLRIFGKLLLKLETNMLGVSGRLGGEEFGLLLPTNTPIAHEQIISQLRYDFASQSELNLGEAMTFSVGACASEQANNVQDLMRHADILLYDAKRKL
ncbi:MAG: GGDEF domain-containing protein [Aliidiomarina sp.]|uniref:GGDEF domain-containing protein n=1 Tax=Aliidiomarina sp. TaxID=1872439 RepID=UPI0025BA8A1A|nr:GGDEF domain-containing protein [Aliidiomarina sp.]MCH8500741.1 GGDEF domain-containing protein [Aliidiomarina sp.]